MSKDGTPAVIGFDTSNYRTSVAAVTLDGEILVNHRELLPVSNGERGLRQSDAVFAHIRQLRDSESALREAMNGRTVAAVAASTMLPSLEVPSISSLKGSVRTEARRVFRLAYIEAYIGWLMMVSGVMLHVSVLEAAFAQEQEVSA